MYWLLWLQSVDIEHIDHPDLPSRSKNWDSTSISETTSFQRVPNRTQSKQCPTPYNKVALTARRTSKPTRISTGNIPHTSPFLKMCKEFFYREKACGCSTEPTFIYCPVTISNCWGLTSSACIAILRQCPKYERIRIARSRFCDVHADEILETGGDDTFYRKALRRERLEEM